MVEVGIALCRRGRLDFAKPLLELGVRDLERFGMGHPKTLIMRADLGTILFQTTGR